MSFLNRTFGKVFAASKGTRGNRKSSSRKPDRRLTLERMESRVLMSANPIGSAAIPIHNFGHLTGSALVAENLPGNLGKPHGPIVVAPAAPKLAISATNLTQANLTWKSVPGATRYVVEELVNGAWKPIASLGSGATSCSVGGLNMDCQMNEFRVGASNAAGTTWSAPAYAPEIC